jgi:hypothetical protein
MDILSALRQSNKLVQGAQQRLKELGTDFKMPEGVFIGNVSKFELKVVKNKPAMPFKFLVVSSGTGEYNGFPTGSIAFLNTDWGIAFALKLLISLGVTEAREYKDQTEFVGYVNHVNKIKDSFSIDITNNKQGFPQYTVLEKVANTTKTNAVSTPKIEENPLADVEENIVNTSNPLETEEIIDDFAEGLPETENSKPGSMYNDNDPSIPDLSGSSIPDLPGLENETDDLNKKIIPAKTIKKLKMLCAGNDLEIPGIKDMDGNQIVFEIQRLQPQGFKGLVKGEKDTLKSVGLEILIK